MPNTSPNSTPAPSGVSYLNEIRTMIQNQQRLDMTLNRMTMAIDRLTNTVMRLANK